MFWLGVRFDCQAVFFCTLWVWYKSDSVLGLFWFLARLHLHAIPHDFFFRASRSSDPMIGSQHLSISYPLFKFARSLPNCKTNCYLDLKMEIELQNKLLFGIENGNWIAKQIVIWNWKWKLNCKTNCYWDLKMEIELVSTNLRNIGRNKFQKHWQKQLGEWMAKTWRKNVRNKF